MLCEFWQSISSPLPHPMHTGGLTSIEILLHSPMGRPTPETSPCSHSSPKRNTSRLTSIEILLHSPMGRPTPETSPCSHSSPKRNTSRPIAQKRATHQQAIRHHPIQNVVLELMVYNCGEVHMTEIPESKCSCLSRPLQLLVHMMHTPHRLRQGPPLKACQPPTCSLEVTTYAARWNVAGTLLVVQFTNGTATLLATPVESHFRN